MCIKPRHSAGVTIIELIMFIVVVSVGITGILAVLNQTVWKSSDPLVQKQVQVIAEGLLEEILAATHAYCDGADALVRYATSASQCTGGTGASYGKESGEARPYSSVVDYADQVSDFSLALASQTPNWTPLSGFLSGATMPSGYAASAAIGPIDLGNIAIGSGDALLIRVRVTGPGSTTAYAEGFKTRQVPQ